MEFRGEVLARVKLGDIRMRPIPVGTTKNRWRDNDRQPDVYSED